jgi:hypothetical protein
MGNLRFVIFAVVLFGAAFAGMSWASKGFPVTAVRIAPLPPDASLPTFEPSVPQSPRQEREESATAQGDGDPRREALRLAALQAATAYALAPCDRATKTNLIQTLSAYAKAWTEMAGCEHGACSGSDRRLDAAAAAFSTPADVRVRAALRAAFAEGGVSREDFPASIRLWVTMLVGDPGDPASTCTTGRQAEVLR